MDRAEPDAKIDEWARAVIGAAIEVHRHLGPGFLESVYKKAMRVEMNLRGIPFEPERHVTLEFKGQVVGEGFLDFLVADCLVVEFKAERAIAPIERARTIQYLKITGLPLALIINFHVLMLRDGIERLVLSGARLSSTSEPPDGARMGG